MNMINKGKPMKQSVIVKTARELGKVQVIRLWGNCGINIFEFISVYYSCCFILII